MYAAMWRNLPGPWPVRLLLAVILLFAVVALLFIVVFPWVDSHLSIDESGVQEGGQVTSR